MNLDAKVCERARLARDARFDGRFFIGVKTTGIYCRPICPVRPPQSRNVRFYPSAAAAAEAGFRPCLRCRPESSPGTPAWLGTSATVSRALRLIGAGALDRGDVEELAARLGIGPRHLSRLFLTHLGASPVAVAQTRRLHFAKKLIDETGLPMTQVALAAGFGSIRRFNAVFLKTYGRSPSSLRKSTTRRDEGSFHLRLPYRPPLNWEALIEFLAGRAIPGVEEVDGETYRRTIALEGSSGTIEVRPGKQENTLEVRIQFPAPRSLFTIVERVRRIFDLGADPAEISAHLGRDPRLAPVLRAYPGLRVPGAWDGFEVSIRAILGQQISVKAATTLSGRLARAFGIALDHGNCGSLNVLFPSPEALAKADLSRIGLTKARRRAIGHFASAVHRGQIVFDGSMPLDDVVSELCRLPGIGDWTAQYVAMRALGEPDAFPASDLALLRAAANGAETFTAKSLRQRAERWRPWRA
ncbi:DNA-3-methyladenine glycosylase 2 family protein, partial [Candidatus Sumerlaeota bacterium]|nr:DNA-3-methyladenine glycosylase 2 family protein [Candidatus Sumerlaeota bacterium]